MSKTNKKAAKTTRSSQPKPTLDDHLAALGKDRASLQGQIEQVLGAQRLAAWGAVLVKLSNFEFWDLASRDRELFDQHLEGVLDVIGRLMHSRFGLTRPANRPTENRERDDKIVADRRAHPEWSFEAIGEQYGVPGTTAQRAYERRVKAEQEEIQALLTLAEELKSWGPPKKS